MSDAISDPSRLDPYLPAVRFDGGNMDCGNGLLLQIRRRIDPLSSGQLLEVRSIEPSVAEDLPAWCRMTGNELVSRQHDLASRSWIFLIAKNRFNPLSAHTGAARSTQSAEQAETYAPVTSTLLSANTAQQRRAVPAIAPLSVMGIGSWPRPDWLLRSLHDRLEGRLAESEFSALADRAVARVIEAQLEAGVDVVTDGEQRRDSYASFVGSSPRELPAHPDCGPASLHRTPRRVRTRVGGASMSRPSRSGIPRFSVSWRETLPGRLPCMSFSRSRA